MHNKRLSFAVGAARRRARTSLHSPLGGGRRSGRLGGANLEPMAILAVAAALVVVLQATGHAHLDPLSGARALGPWGLAVAILGVLPMVWRVALWLTYRPAPEVPDDQLPAVTVVIPAYNEGPAVADTVRSLLASDYPDLRIVVVDDGSRDDTLHHARLAATLDPDRVDVVALGDNRGKRHALFAGFQQVRTPVVVTVDSDTVVPPRSLRALVAPLVLDPEVHAVAGRIDVLNRDDTLISRMLNVRYRLGFDFVRAAQSQLGAVLVCPGAFSAYRVSGVADAWPAWRDQTFLGARCTNGDDHALTNVVLSRGHKAVYQSTAVAQTGVPTTFRRLALMYLRWTRSNLRESTRWLGFVPGLLRRPRRWPAVIDGVAHFLSLPARLVWPPALWVAVVLNPASLLTAIAAALVSAALYAVVYLRSERSVDAVYLFAYAVFALLTLGWIYPAALVSIRQSRWLTR